MSHHLGWLTSGRKDFKMTKPKLAITTVLSLGVREKAAVRELVWIRVTTITKVSGQEDVCNCEE